MSSSCQQFLLFINVILMITCDDFDECMMSLMIMMILMIVMISKSDEGEGLLVSDIFEIIFGGRSDYFDDT